jgi:hypothetical protein
MSLVFQNIDPSPPSHSPGGEGRGGSIFWKTRDIGLPSYSNNLSTPSPFQGCFLGLGRHSVGTPSAQYCTYIGTHRMSKYLFLTTPKYTPHPHRITPRPEIFKLLRSPRIDFKESIPPAYLAWRAGTATIYSYSVPSPIDC